MTYVAIVVPCFNEARRLDLARFESLLHGDTIRLTFVDDGSTDSTLDLIRRFALAHEGRVDVVALARNMGKGEAVRAGLRRALADGAPYVGYSDADLATPPRELRRLVDRALSGDYDVVMGSRVARAGASIDRRPLRHYLGRVFATYASLVLDASLYDTQCGAKVLRSTPALGRALEEPFVSRWVFDIELLGRLRYDETTPIALDRVLELPLDEWSDVSGSHIRLSSTPSIAIDILKATSHIATLRRTRAQIVSRRLR